MDDVTTTGMAPDFNVFGWPYTGFVTLFALAVYFVFLWRVGRARGRYKVEAPDTDGPPEFRRILRVQVNTLEHLVIFLPLLWIAALSFRDEWAAAIGLFWPIGRILYGLGYVKEPKKRYPGFLLSTLTTVLLFILSAAQLVRSLLVWP